MNRHSPGLRRPVPFRGHVADTAAWAARRMQASAGAAAHHRSPGACAQRRGPQRRHRLQCAGEAAHKLSEEDEARSKRRASRGACSSTACASAPSPPASPEVDIRQRYGDLEETLVEQEERVRCSCSAAAALRRDHPARPRPQRRARGARPAQPILTVTDDFTEPERVMIAFDGGAVTRRGVEMVADSPLFRGLPILCHVRQAPARCREADSTGPADPEDAGLRRQSGTDARRHGA
jgi:hypothetical protein